MSDTASTEHVHFVTVTTKDDYPVDVTFECRADPTARCRVYPDCGCETWDEDGEIPDGETATRWNHSHPSVPQTECWLQAWFDNDGTSYEGDDTDGDGQPTLAQTGPVDHAFEGDYVSWTFLPVLTTLRTVPISDLTETGEI